MLQIAKNGVVKLSKGLLLLFTVSSSFFLITLLSQSCSKNEYFESTSVNDNIKKEKRSVLLNAIKTSEKQIKENKFSMLSANSTEESPYPGNLTEGEVTTFIENLRSPSVELINSYGISDQEIINEFGSLDNPLIEKAAMLISYTEDSVLALGHSLNIFESEDFLAGNSLLISSCQAQDPTIGGCLSEAAGIYIIRDLFKYGIKKLGKKGALKLIKKVASKYAGWVGAAIMVLDFSECMGWTDFY